MYNKKVLSEATKNLDRAVAPAKKKDIITDPMGQWNHPGKDTRIPGNDITMEGVPYPVWAVPNVGAPQMMYPGIDYKFPEADYVDEFPQNEDYYEDELTEDEIAELKAGGYIVEDISVPQLTQAQFGTATVPTQEETQFAQRSTKGIPYADKEITLPEVTVTPAGYKGPTNLNDPLALLSPQQRTLAQGKGPVQTGKVNSYNKPLSDKQWKRQQAKDKLIRSGVAAEMYPGYMDQDLMGIQEPVELGEIMDYDPNINQNAEDARYRIWKRNEERAYQNAGYGDRLLNEFQSFASNPVQQVTRALTGKRSLMGQGYRDIAGEEYDDTRFYDRSKTGLEATMGATGEIFNLFNPMHYGAKAGHRINQGRYLDAAGNIAQGALTGMGAGLAKGALPLMSKVPGATGQNLFRAQMLGQSMYDTPSTIGDWFDPNVSFAEAAINTGFTGLGYLGAKSGFKSLGQDIKALAPKQTLPGAPSYLKDMKYSLLKQGKLPTYKTVSRWQPDVFPKELVEAGKRELSAEQQALTGSWYGYAPKGLEQDARVAQGFYLQTRPGAGDMHSLRMSDRQINELEKSMSSHAKGMSGKSYTQSTSNDWQRGELNIPAELRQNAKKTRFDVNPSEYISTVMPANANYAPNSPYHKFIQRYEIGQHADDVVNSQYGPIFGIPRQYFPYKKGGEKKFSRSLEAKNKLFAENPFLKKKKSKKRKIFDPNAKYYQDGGAQLPEDYAQFINFNQTLPSNLQDPEYQYGNPDQYDLYGMWNTLGKPGSFKDVQDSDYFPLQDDGTYHGFSVGSDGTLLKPMSHSTTWKEVMNSQLNTDPYFKENRLIKNEQGRLQYVPNRKKGGFQDDLGKHRQLLRDWTYGQSIGMLQEKQSGGEPTPIPKPELGLTDAIYIANKDLPEVTVKDKAPNWVRYAKEYENIHSLSDFIYDKKKAYLKHYKGLNKAAGVTMENFPKDVEQNFRNEYEYNKNGYITRRIGKEKGFKPNRRGEWVDELNSGEEKIVANSKYGVKLQPTTYSRMLSGLQQLGNTILPGQPFDYDIPGMTKKEEKEAKESKLSGLDIFAGTEALGNKIAGELKNSGLSTGSNYKEVPFLSGERMANVNLLESSLLNPFTYASLVTTSPKQISNAFRKSLVVNRNIRRAISPVTKPISNFLDKERTFEYYHPLTNQDEVANLGTIGDQLRALTVGTTFYNIPSTARKVGYDLSAAVDSSNDINKKIDHLGNAVWNTGMMGVGMSPLTKWGLTNIYNTTPSAAMSFTDNAEKLRKGNPEGLRAAFNLSRLAIHKEGGEIYEDEIDDETRKQLEALGYIIEDLD